MIHLVMHVTQNGLESWKLRDCGDSIIFRDQWLKAQDTTRPFLAHETLRHIVEGHRTALYSPNIALSKSPQPRKVLR